MERVAGIQTGGSERAFDLYMKARYLGELHEGHGVTFATGTPISNTMVEMYTMQRFLDPKGLRDRGIEHFDGWAATFGEVVDTMEIAPDGATLEAAEPVREVREPARAAADVPGVRRRADGRDARPADGPASRAASRASSPCPMSEEQRAIQERLVARYERIRSQKVDPREDNALAITTDGRKLALDARLISGDVPGVPRVEGRTPSSSGSRTSGGGRRRSAGRSSSSATSGVNPTPWGYSVYDEVIAKLVAARHPAGADRRGRGRRERREEAGPLRAGAAGDGAGAHRQHAEDGDGGQRAAAARVPSITSTPRGSRPRSSSGRAESCGRGTRTRRSPSSAT